MEKSIIVDISHHNTYEDWIIVKSDGTMIYHHELDGWSASKEGPKPKEKPITLDEVAKRFPQKLDEVRRALVDVAASTK